MKINKLQSDHELLKYILGSMIAETSLNSSNYTELQEIMTLVKSADALVEDQLEKSAFISQNLRDLYIGAPNELISVDEFSYIRKYEMIKDAGGDARLINDLATQDEVIPNIRIKILDKLFDLSLEDIQRIVYQNN